MKNIDHSSKIFGISFFGGSNDQLLMTLTKHTSSANRLITVVTPNPEQIVESRKNPDFLDHIKSADYALPDGVGIVRASQLLSIPLGQPVIKERITGIDIVSRLLIWAAHTSKVVLVVGGRGYQHTDWSVTSAYQALGLSRLNLTIHQLLSEERAAAHQASAVNVLPTQLEHWYWHEGYQDISAPTTNEEKLLSKAIKELQPDIVFVAFGAPYQESWLMQHRQVLEQAGTKIGMVVGGSFDILLGRIKRAPRVVQKVGLEWLFRLIQQPHRFKRQLKLAEFIKLVLVEARLQPDRP